MLSQLVKELLGRSSQYGRLHSQVPTKAVEEKTQWEAFNGIMPSVSHLKVFGCTAYVHVPDEKKKKLDFKSEKMVFVVGYSSTSKAYQLWNPKKKEIVISRDVFFVEDFTCKDDKDSSFHFPSSLSLEPSPSSSTSSPEVNYQPETILNPILHPLLSLHLLQPIMNLILLSLNPLISFHLNG